MKPVSLLTVVVLIFFSLVHLLRLFTGTTVTVGGVEIPIWASLPVAVGCGALALGLWNEHLRTRV
jgi:hypothetical protein